MNKGLQYNQNKDQRIAWLSVFSSLTKMKPVEEIDELANKAFEVVKKLYETYPFPKDVEDLNQSRLIKPKGWIAKPKKEGEAPF